MVMPATHCNHCSAPDAGDSVTLWDGCLYCRNCVREASPSLLALAESGGPLEETIDRNDIRASYFIKRIGTFWSLGVMLVVGIPLCWATIFEKMPVDLAACALVVLVAFGWLYFTLQAWVHVAQLRSRLPRTVRVERGRLMVLSPQGEEMVAPSECKWQLGKADQDVFCNFTGLRYGVMIQTPSQVVGCGYTPELQEHWCAFLTLARIPVYLPLGCLRSIAITAFGTLVGAAIGYGLAAIVAVLKNAAGVPHGFGLIGAIDGTIVGVIAAQWGSEGVKSSRARLHPLILGFSFFAVVLAFSGSWQAVTVAAINGLLGALLGWFCQVKLRAHDFEQGDLR